MISLIKNEFKKIFKKKTIFVLVIILFAYVMFINLIDHLVTYNYTEDIDESIKIHEENLAMLNPTKEEDNKEYIYLKTILDQIKLAKNYDEDSWQYYYINNNMFDLLYNINENTYGLNKNVEDLKTYQKIYDINLTRFKSGDWKSFANEEYKASNKKLTELEKELTITKDKMQIKSINMEIEKEKINNQALKYRIEKDISYGNSFLSNAVNEYQTNGNSIIDYKYNDEKSNDKNEEEYNKTSIENFYSAKYYIENDIAGVKNGILILYSLFEQYGFLIIIFSIIIAGTIVGTEYQKGTIKALLTKPRKREKILFAKFITSILMMIIFILLTIFVQYVVAGIIDGFDIYKVPILSYDFVKNELITMNSINYALLIALNKLPMYILITTLAFLLSTLFINSVVSIALPVIVYTFSEVINIYVEKYKILKYLPMPNWDLSIYLFGGEGIIDSLDITKSLIICGIYFVIMLIFAVIVFKRRDIKNV